MKDKQSALQQSARTQSLQNDQLVMRVCGWQAKAPGLDSKEQWQKWAGDPVAPTGKWKKTLQLVPKSMGRRCSQLSAMALEVALSLTEAEMPDYAVFASQHGEISRTLGLLDSIAQQELLSPIAFSQSVHNTVAGLFTIVRKSNIAVSSMGAGSDSFSMALVEAFSYLKLHPQEKVMVIFADEILPDLYQRPELGSTSDLCIGMFLQLADEGDSFAPAGDEQPSAVEDSQSDALKFLYQLVSGHSQVCYGQLRGSARG